MTNPTEEAREALARVTHEWRDHAIDGTPLGGFLCNCYEYADAVIAAGFRRQVSHPEPVTDEMVDAGMKADDLACRQMQGPFMRMRTILEAARAVWLSVPEEGS